jgi:Ricin-type beta-trefoil lectin domain-like
MRLNLRRPRALAATLLAGLAVAVVPAAAQASSQSLQNVAVATNVSDLVLVLDVAGGSTANGAGVIQWYGSFAGNQRWNVVDQGDGTETIVNQNSGKCLTTDGVAGHQLYQFTCVGSPLQKWQSNMHTLGTPNNVSTIRNPSTGLNVDVNGASRWAGAKIIGWYPSNADNQYFGYYQLF